MAGIKYQCEFYTNNNSRYRINIYHVDYSSTVVPFKGGIEGFTLKYEGGNDPVYKAIKASTLEFDFQIEEDPAVTPTTGNIYEDLLANNESKLFVIVEHYDYPDTAWRTWWAGDIIDDTVTIADAPLPTTIRIRATDGIAKMKQKLYTPETGASWICVLYYFQKAIEQTLYYSTTFPSSGGTATIPIRNTANRYNANMGDITDTTWKNTYNPYKLAFVNEAAFQNDDGTWMSYYDILDQLATLYGVQFFMSVKEFQNLGVTWWLMSRSVMFNETSGLTSSCRVFENQAYTSGGDALTQYEYSIPNTSTLATALDVTQEVGLDLSTNRPKLKGNKISYYSPLGQVQTNYFHDLMSYPLNMSFENPSSPFELDQYTNISGSVIGGYGSLLGFYGSGAVETNDPLNSPYFPAGMSYTGTDTSYGANNDGWFIPVTDGQDTIVVSGQLTISYKFSWSGAYAAFTAQLSGENSYIDTSFRLPIIFRIIHSNKSSADYAQAQADDDDLDDSEIRRWLNGTYGSGGGNAATWSSTVPNWATSAWELSTIKIMVDNPPLENDEQMTITVPFSFVSEPLPDLHGGVQDYLKRTQFEVGELTVGNIFQGPFEDLIDAGVVDIENFNVTITDFQQALIFNGSQISNYFGTGVGLYNNYNTDASSRMEIKPDFFIGDPPNWISTAAGGLDPANLSPTQYFGGIRIFAPSASDPTTTVPNQLQTNSGEWRTQNDSVEKQLHILLVREIIKKRCFPIYKYDIKFQIVGPNNTGALYNIGFWNTLKINMRLNENQSDDIKGFFPTGGTYTAVTNTWHLTVQQMDLNTETNIVDSSHNVYNDEPFINNPNIFLQVDF